jgi:hypothetical protein
VVPADQLIEEVAAVSGPLKKYKVVRNGFETVMKLSDADAAKLGAGPYQVSDAVSTIEPVTAVAESIADAEATEPVQESDSDGQAESQVADSGDVEDAAAEPQQTAGEAPVRKRSTAANKARTGSANKADGGS